MLSLRNIRLLAAGVGVLAEMLLSCSSSLAMLIFDRCFASSA